MPICIGAKRRTEPSDRRASSFEPLGVTDRILGGFLQFTSPSIVTARLAPLCSRQSRVVLELSADKCDVL